MILACKGRSHSNPAACPFPDLCDGRASRAGMDLWPVRRGLQTVEAQVSLLCDNRISGTTASTVGATGRSPAKPRPMRDRVSGKPPALPVDSRN